MRKVKLVCPSTAIPEKLISNSEYISMLTLILVSEKKAIECINIKQEKQLRIKSIARKSGRRLLSLDQTM